MKICITAKGPSPLSAMDNDFKNCAYFIFFVDGSMGFEATINNKEKDPEQLLIDKEANILITKNISSQSLTMLNNAKIEVFTDSSKLITDALSRFRKGELKLVRKIDINSNLQ